MDVVLPCKARDGLALLRKINLPTDKGWREASLKEIGGKRHGLSACVVRYGAYGDLMIASAIIPRLKAKGFHVTFNTTERGEEIIRADPMIDELLLQKKNQVPQKELPEYWEWMKQCFSKFINLSETIEGRLLAGAGRPEFEMSQEWRHKRMNRNYMEETFKEAKLPFTPEDHPRFVPTKKERKFADGFIKKIHKEWHGPVMMYVLSGSSVHKWTPHQDQLIARLLYRYPTLNVLLVGDYSCKILETGWEEEPRVHCLSGEISIRRTLALAQRCDVVVGPETGVMHVVSGTENVGKVVSLSHSSAENLSKHWLNTIALEPKDVPCWPCHQLHISPDTCNREPIHHSAMCAYNISVDELEWAVNEFLKKR